MKPFYIVGIRNAKWSDGIGLWRDENEKIWVDPIKLYEDIREALKAGEENRQECILEINVGEGDAYLNCAESVEEQMIIINAFQEGKTSGYTQLYQTYETNGKELVLFTVTDTPLEGVETVPCSYRFIYTDGSEGRFTYYLNLLIAKTQKAGSIFPFEPFVPFTVRIGSFAFAPNGGDCVLPAIRAEYGNEDDRLHSVAFVANGRTWYCVRGVPQEVTDTGQTFKVNAKSETALLHKVITYWEKLGGNANVGRYPSPSAVVSVKVSDGWLNLRP